MTDKLDIIDSVLKGEEPPALQDPAPAPAPEIKLEQAPEEALAQEVKPEAPQEMTYEERVKKNIESSHSRVELIKELLSKYGELLSAQVLEDIVEQSENDAKEKIQQPGYDPTKYADIARTDSMMLAKRVAEARKSSIKAFEEEKQIDHLNAIDEFGKNNIDKKDKALKWYSEVRKVPLELLENEPASNKYLIYKAYNKLDHRQAEIDPNDKKNKTLSALDEFLS